ncbi:MAG TPA: hypothetical protein DCK97_10515 [Tistrella mobilis]|uniref:Uncharacterized protein n=1 Tax=Tistrella mobilis TaxID=171437 RepID=A0A3B9IIY9_9PROT|nr:hypothetical protein [Tistrella mobilis]
MEGACGYRGSPPIHKPSTEKPPCGRSGGTLGRPAWITPESRAESRGIMSWITWKTPPSPTAVLAPSPPSPGGCPHGDGSADDR